MQPANNPDRDASGRSRADLLTSAVFIVFAVAALYASWTMPRLEARQIHPSTIPGLVPMLLSGALLICSGLLFFRSVRKPAPGGWSALFGSMGGWAGARFFVTLLLVLVFTLGLVGRMPFWLASALFMFAFILVFEVALPSGPVNWRRSLLWAAFIAIVSAFTVTLVFERLFLVRLP